MIISLFIDMKLTSLQVRYILVIYYFTFLFRFKSYQFLFDHINLDYIVTVAKFDMNLNYKNFFNWIIMIDFLHFIQ